MSRIRILFVLVAGAALVATAPTGSGDMPTGYAAIGGFYAITPTTPGHVFQVTCTSLNCGTFTSGTTLPCGPGHEEALEPEAEGACPFAEPERRQGAQERRPCQPEGRQGPALSPER
jgi:hypothetical protein